MEPLSPLERMRRRRKGQTLAEFAITLPILLLLMFGIIEFGRIFQAWVTLQNSARAAARYASTGQYYTDRYVMDTVTGNSDPTGFIPCVNDRDPAYGGVDQRGTKNVNYFPNNPLDPSDRMQVYQGGLESLFATWNDGRNCDPTNESHQEMRKDMARILSIMEEARRGAAGLALENNALTVPSDKTVVEGQPWFEVWKRPLPRSDQRGWFNVMICSTRARLNEVGGSGTYHQVVLPGGTTPVTSRFVTYLGDQQLQDYNGNGLNPPSPACLLNEIPTDSDISAGALNNAGKPWLDPGGPADSVSIVVTFNHPLITPLGLAPFIQMQARRTAIVESFRAARAVSAINNPGAANPAFDTPTFTPTFTPSVTPTPTATGTSTPRPTNTPSSTPYPPFSCNLIEATLPRITGNTISIQIRNNNLESTFLTRVVYRWRAIPSFPGMFASDLSLNGIPHWRGEKSSPTFVDTNADPSNPPFTSVSELDRTIAGFDTGDWTALMGNGPQFLQQYMTPNDLAGTTFYLFNPRGPVCEVSLTLPTPTPNPNPDQPTPTFTPTFTPDCASANLRVRFVRFEQYGIVRLEVLNYSNQVAPFTNFSIVWPQRWPGILTLDRVTTVAPLGQTGSVTVWESNSPTQDANPPTVGKSEGRWVRDYIFSPAIGPGNPSITPLLLDFGGVASPLSALGIQPNEFNGSWFEIYCGRPGSSFGGGGGGETGRIVLSEIPTPVPTNTPGPTRTPGPTFTPSRTPTPQTPTLTFTPGPTRTPSRTPLPTNTPSPVPPSPLPTIPDTGPAD